MMLQGLRLRELSFLTLAFFTISGCQHKKTVETSRWQVSYFGTRASANRANNSGKTIEADLELMNTCTPVEPGQVRCVSKKGMAVLFTLQSTAAQLYGKSSGDESPLGTVNLTCQSPFADGQPVVCDQADRP